MEKNESIKVKFIVVGNKAVGKSCIINQYLMQIFENEHIPTLASDKNIKEVEIENQKIILEIWDTVGQEEYRAINKIFMKNTQIALLVYDITNEDSFKKLEEFYQQICDINGKDNIIIAVDGNKTDLYEERVVEEEDGKKFAHEKNISFFETSAKDYESIENVFINLCQQYITHISNKKEIIEEEIERRKSIIIDRNSVKKYNKPKKGGCCKN